MYNNCLYITGPELTRMEYFTSILTEPLPKLLVTLTVIIVSVILYYFVLPTSNYIEQPRYTEEDEGKLSIEKYPIKVPPELNMEKLKDFAKEQVEIVIHVVKDCELNAALQYMTPPEFDDEIKLKNCVRYPRDNSTLGIFGTYKIALVQTEMGGNAEEEIETAVIKDFPNSKYVIALGMAYGRKQICNLGDVLVSKEIHDMSKKVTFSAGNITSHGGEQTVQLNLVHVFTRGERIWTLKKGFERTKSTGSEKSKAIVGTILSPPWLVKDERIKEMIFAHKSDAIGGEMEGNVLTRLRDYMKRHHKDRSLGIIIIKGVADHGDRKKNDKWQFTASMAAADYTSFKLENAILCQ